MRPVKPAEPRSDDLLRRDAQRRPVHLEAEVFDLMTKWIERYRQRAEERFARLDAVLAEMSDETQTDNPLEGTAS